MSVSTHMTVVTEDNQFTKIYKLQNKTGLSVYSINESLEVDKTVVDSLNKSESNTKKFIVRAKNCSEKEFKIVCDENTEFLCRKEIDGKLMFIFVPVSKIDMTTLIVTDEGADKLCLLTKKSDITANTKDEFVDVTKNMPFICIQFVIRNV